MELLKYIVLKIRELYMSKIKKRNIIDVYKRQLCTFNVDGETMHSNHFEIQIFPSRLKVFNDRNFIEEII